MRSPGGAEREPIGWAVEPGRSWGSFLTGDQSGDGAQHGVEMVASAEVSGQGPPVLQVADAVLHADPLRRMGPAFGLVRGGEGGRDRQLVVPPGRPRVSAGGGVQFTGGGELHAAGAEVGAGTAPARVRGRAGRDRSAAVLDRMTADHQWGS